ncbi:unnamed protein product [Ectocarpus sp. CCAP 1310/34]|nr:unnamed protein product [Ectocarpus sp. CCAP 1310/34]
MGGGGGGGGAQGTTDAHYAPFQPDAENHLRNFAVTADERRQMEEDYRLALAMQKGEAAAANGTGGRGVPVAAPVQAPPASSAGSSSFSRMLGNERDGNSGGAGGGGIWRRSSGSKGDKDDEWELERRARIEKVSWSLLKPTHYVYFLLVKARMADAEETATADNELGEMASFLNGGSGGRGVGNGGVEEAAPWDQELEAGGALKGGHRPVSDGEEVYPRGLVDETVVKESPPDEDSSDDDEYRRDIAQFTARRKGGAV